ncbi:MAG: hypothetical protein KF764_23095 [Labilithrix sp.]|nr:hypothetical protein [Labilithrix sp.]
MSVTASVVLAVAERVERTGGARAGLVAWRTLAGNAADAEVRGRALVAALRCALALRDAAAIDELTARWESVDSGVWDDAIASLAIELVRAGLVPRAVALARAEARRHRTARSLYCYARCLDVARDPDAADALRDAIARAEKEGAREIELASRVRRAAVLARDWATTSEAIEEARRVELAEVPPGSRLVVASVMLRSPSRFSRAAGLAALDAIAGGDDAALSARAVALAARWADDVRDELTTLEADRLVALFGREAIVKAAPRAKEAARALARIAAARDDAALGGALDDAARMDSSLASLHARARDVLRGRYEAPPEGAEPPPADPARRRAFRWSELLDVVVALRDRAPARAARTLRALAEAAASGERLPAEVLGVAHAALTYDDPELREVASGLVAQRLRRACAGAPPRGWGRLADTLAGLGMTELSTSALRAAAAAKEPGAAESLGSELVREGWELAGRGDRARAIAKLHEAKALLAASRRDQFTQGS